MFFGRGFDLWRGIFDKKTRKYTKSDHTKPRGGSTVFGFYSKNAKFFHEDFPGTSRTLFSPR